MLLGACDLGLDSEEAVHVSLSVHPQRFEPGSPIALEGIATNVGTETVEAGVGCSPGIGFYVRRAPDTVQRVGAGPEYSLYDEAAFTCELKDSNRLSRFETDTVRFLWTPEVGFFEVRAALARPDGPSHPSEWILVTPR